jgi:Rab-GTPase-TBC domain
MHYNTCVSRAALRGVLRCLTAFLPADVGYVQGQNLIARFILRVTDENEEDTFW